MYLKITLPLFLKIIFTISSCDQAQQNLQLSQSQSQITQAADLITGAMINMKAPNKCAKPVNYDCTNECEQKPPAGPSNALADAIATMVPLMTKPGQNNTGGKTSNKELECITGKKQDCTSESRGTAENALMSVLAQTSKQMEAYQNQKKECEKKKEQEEACKKQSPSNVPFGNTCETAQQLRQLIDTTPVQPQKQPECKPPISPQIMDIMKPPQDACEAACQKPDPAASAPTESIIMPKSFKYRNPPGMPDFTLSAPGKPQCIGTATTLSTECSPPSSDCITTGAKPTRPTPLKECESGSAQNVSPQPTTDCGSGGQSLATPFSSTPSLDCGSSAMPTSSPSLECGTSTMPTGTSSLECGTSTMPTGSPSLECGTSTMPTGSPSLECGTSSMPTGTSSTDCGTSTMPTSTFEPDAEWITSSPYTECSTGTMPNNTQTTNLIPTAMTPTFPQPAKLQESPVTNITIEPPEPCNPPQQQQTTETIPQINVQELLAQTEKKLACHRYVPTPPPPIIQKRSPAPTPTPASNNQMNIPGLENLSNIQKMCCDSKGECPCVPIINVYPVIYK
ncbi:hypothetical protein M153_1300001942 [Pseudoloma neurophilia]|uniref:Uncharacterized protein n=1 Tax=Pseudoloma neurophilia TaxID=146866 RepID=A0A0R0LZU3_9MICR|nr:hypothetical protein M153_1300001942 [Pseudoloma neurophilia]